MPTKVEGSYLIRASKRGASPSSNKVPPLHIKERGAKGVRLVNNLSTKIEGGEGQG